MSQQFDMIYTIARDNEQQIRQASYVNSGKDIQQPGLTARLASLLRRVANRIDREQVQVSEQLAVIERRNPLALPMRYDPCADAFVYEAARNGATK